MAHQTKQTSVTTTAAALNSGVLPQHGHLGFTVTLFNSGTTDCYIGGSGVTSTTGYLLKAGTSLQELTVKSGELLYAVTATGSTTVGALIAGAQ